MFFFLLLFYVILFLVCEFREIVFNLYSCILSSLLRPYSVQVPLHIVMYTHINTTRDTEYIYNIFGCFSFLCHFWWLLFVTAVYTADVENFNNVLCGKCLSLVYCKEFCVKYFTQSCACS